MPRMKPALALALFFALALAGCGQEDPVGRLLDHQEAVLGALEKHTGTADEAAEVLESYVKEHGEELAQLKADGKAFVTEHAEDAQAAMIHQAQRIKAVTERYAKILADHPDLPKSDRFNKAYEALFN